MKRHFTLPRNWFGIASVLFTLAFWTYVNLPFAAHSQRLNVAFLGILSCGIPAALIAARRGSKLWLISLLGPLSGWMLVLTFWND